MLCFASFKRETHTHNFPSTLHLLKVAEQKCPPYQTVGEPGSEDPWAAAPGYQGGVHDRALPSPGDDSPAPAHPTGCFLEACQLGLGRNGR